MDLPAYCFLAATGPSPALGHVAAVGALLVLAGLVLAWRTRTSLVSLLGLLVVGGLALSLAAPVSAEASPIVRNDLPECDVAGEDEKKRAATRSHGSGADNEPLRVSSMELRPGDSIILAGAGYEPGSRVALTMFSEPTDLLPGGALVSESGRFAVEVEVPEIDDGSHTITAEGVTSGGGDRRGSIGVSLDGTPPEIDANSFSFTSPADIENVKPGDTLTFQIKARDTSGIESLSAVIYDITTEEFDEVIDADTGDTEPRIQYRSHVQRDNFCGQTMSQILGPDLDGWETWGLSCSVTSSWVNGDYDMFFIASDQFFLRDETELPDPLFDDDYQPLAAFSVVDASEDYLGPDLTSVEIVPAEATYSPGSLFTIEITANDPSGVEQVGFIISTAEMMTFLPGTDDEYSQPIQRDTFCGQNTTRRPGTDVWVAQCQVTSNWINGDYVVRAFAVDTLGNFTNTNSGREIDVSDDFTIVGASDDKIGPTIISISPSSGRFTFGDRINFSVVAEDPSGVEWIYIGIRDLDREVERYFCNFVLETSTPNAIRSTWSIACEVDWTFVHGNYELFAYGQDKLGNFTGVNNFPESPLRGGFSIY